MIITNENDSLGVSEYIPKLISSILLEVCTSVWLHHSNSMQCMAMVVMASIQFRIIVISGDYISYTQILILHVNIFSLYSISYFSQMPSYHREEHLMCCTLCVCINYCLRLHVAKVLSLVASCCNRMTYWKAATLAKLEILCTLWKWQFLHLFWHSLIHFPFLDAFFSLRTVSLRFFFSSSNATKHKRRFN